MSLLAVSPPPSPGDLVEPPHRAARKNDDFYLLTSCIPVIGEAISYYRQKQCEGDPTYWIVTRRYEAVTIVREICTIALLVFGLYKGVFSYPGSREAAFICIGKCSHNIYRIVQNIPKYRAESERLIPIDDEPEEGSESGRPRNTSGVPRVHPESHV